MAPFCSQIQDRRDMSAINQVQETYQFVAQIGTNEFASADKFTVKLPGLFRTLAKIGIRHSLSQRRFVVHSSDSLNQTVIELANGYRHAAFLRAPHVLARLLRQSFPPVFE